MVINKEKIKDTSHIEFVDYKASPYCLCHGTLTLKIDGKTVTFGNSTENYPSFWTSGGGITADYEAYSGEWIIDVEEIPEQYRQYAEEIDYVFNQNVMHGCCGGCI